MGYKKLFLLTPVLWLRKVLLYILATFILLGILVYFVANSPWVIKKAADMFAPDYNISYSRIHGNVLTGVQIEDLAYNHKPLVKHLEVKWNPNALLKKQIFVNHAMVNHANVETIKTLMELFSGDESADSEDFPFSLYMKKMTINFDPFEENNIEFKNILLDAKEIFYDSSTIEIGQINLAIDSNITKITLQANAKNTVATVEKLDIQDIDTLAIEQLIAMYQDENNDANKTEDTTRDTTNPLGLSQLHIKQLHIDILPVSYKPVEIKSLILKLQDSIFYLPELMFKDGSIEVATETNFAKAVHKGTIKNNQLLGLLNVRPYEELFRYYDLPLEPTSMKELEIHVDASKKRVIASIDTNMTQVLKADKKAFNIDIDTLKSTVTFMFDDSSLKAKTIAKLSTPYAKNIILHNSFTMEDTISYSGDIFIKQIIGVDAKYVKPIHNLTLNYEGNEKRIDTSIDSAMFEGTFSLDDFRHAHLHLESKEALVLREYISLPSELNTSHAFVEIDAPLSFEDNASYVATVNVKSNVANIDANVSYKDTVHFLTYIDLPKDSLLRAYSEELKWDTLMPIKIEANLLKNGLESMMTAGPLKTKARYDFDSTELKGTVSFGSLQANISGMSEKEIKIDSSIASVPLLMKSISEIYALEDLPKVEGNAALSLSIRQLKEATLSLRSPLLVYHADHKSSMEISDLDVKLHYEEGQVVLKHYRVTIENEKIYASKPSVVSFGDDNITLKPLWINDRLKAEGNYDLKTKKGQVLINADKFHISHEMIDFDSSMDIKGLLDGNKTKVQGKIVLLGGDIHYDIAKKSFVSDSDIIIVQDMKNEEPSLFMDNMSVNVQVTTKKPLGYKKDAIDMKVKVDVSLHKVEHAPLLVLGSVEIVKGGSYLFQNKKFVVDKGFVYFTGNPNKPLLDIKVHYKGLNHLITVSVTGSADLPRIEFSSKPSLTKEQILSLILFDTEAGAGTNSGDEMMKMMGGAMAKSALNNLGIKLDHLVLGEGNSVEVGKKLTDEITIIYVNDTISEVKLKYRHSDHTESVIGASEKSESYDLIYKIDF